MFFTISNKINDNKQKHRETYFSMFAIWFIFTGSDRSTDAVQAYNNCENRYIYTIYHKKGFKNNLINNLILMQF